VVALDRRIGLKNAIAIVIRVGELSGGAVFSAQRYAIAPPVTEINRNLTAME
jgi:hypothetical protein